MNVKIKTASLGMVLIAILLLSACAPKAVAEPTPDLVMIRTQAVQTAVAEMTVQAALNPTATSVPATLTPLPTATVGTPVPAAGSSSGSSGNSGGSGGSGGSTGTKGPTATPDAWKCQLVDEYPLDKPQMTGWEYDRHWVIKNAGTSVWWSNDVYVEFDDSCTICENIAYQDKFYIKKDVYPGETIDIFVDIDVPTSPKAFPGFTMAWNMESGQAGLICEFWNNVPSTYPPYPTLTPKP